MDHITDWRVVGALLAIIAAVFLLIAWQRRGTMNAASGWLMAAALPLELLGLALSIFWAVSAPQGAILPIIFVIGWVAMTVGRAALIPVIVAQNSTTVRAFATFGLIMAYSALYSSGLFHALNADSDAAQARLEKSKPALALDAEIERARQAVASLSIYADAAQAEADIEAHRSAKIQAEARKSYLEMRMDDDMRQTPKNSAGKSAGKSLGELTRNCAESYSGHYSGDCAEVWAMRKELEALNNGLYGSNVGASGYADKHSQYGGAQAHLATLMFERAKLSHSGGGVIEQWNADDRAIAWIFGMTPEQANRVKWLVFTLIFDVLALVFRLVAAMISDGTAALKNRIARLLDAGLSPVDAAKACHQGGDCETAQSIRHEQPRQAFGFSPPSAPPATAVRDSLPPQTQARATGHFRSWQEQAHARLMDAPISAPISAPSGDKKSERVHAHLSQRQGAGRVGKMDACIDCGEDYRVTAHNGLRCKKCSAVAEAAYRRRGKK
jgi:hypothetical protein